MGGRVLTAGSSVERAELIFHGCEKRRTSISQPRGRRSGEIGIDRATTRKGGCRGVDALLLFIGCPSGGHLFNAVLDSVFNGIQITVPLCVCV
jgi:hypothetical protein